MPHSAVGTNRTGLTLIEAVVALTILSIGIVGIIGAITMAGRIAASAARFERAVEIAERELAVAVSVGGDELRPASDSRDGFAWTVAYSSKTHGLTLASVTVQWQERSEQQSFSLRRVFTAIPPAGELGRAEGGR